MKKLIIDRKKWFRGRGADSSGLLLQDGSMCCLGFYCIQIAQTKSISGSVIPSQCLTDEKLGWLGKRFRGYVNKPTVYAEDHVLDPYINNKAEDIMAIINDLKGVCEKSREAWIKEGFKQLGNIDAEFIN